MTTETIDRAKQDVLPNTNGWRNYPTWAVALWIDNDEGLASARDEAIAEIAGDRDADDWGTDADGKVTPPDISDAVEDWLRAFVDEMVGETGSGTFLGDLISWAVDYVDFAEIAEAWSRDYWATQDPPEPDADD